MKQPTAKTPKGGADERLQYVADGACHQMAHRATKSGRGKWIGESPIASMMMVGMCLLDWILVGMMTFAIAYLAINYQDLPPDQRMFADCEAWIVEKALQESPNRALYELWREQGWLKVCPGRCSTMPSTTSCRRTNRDSTSLCLVATHPLNTIRRLAIVGIDANGWWCPVFVIWKYKLEWLLNRDGRWSYTNDPIPLLPLPLPSLPLLFKPR